MIRLRIGHHTLPPTNSMLSQISTMSNFLVLHKFHKICLQGRIMLAFHLDTFVLQLHKPLRLHSSQHMYSNGSLILLALLLTITLSGLSTDLFVVLFQCGQVLASLTELALLHTLTHIPTRDNHRLPFRVTARTQIVPYQETVKPTSAKPRNDSGTRVDCVPVHKGALGVHEVKFVVQAGEDLSNGSRVGDHAHSTLHLSQVTACGHQGHVSNHNTILREGIACQE